MRIDWIKTDGPLPVLLGTTVTPPKPAKARRICAALWRTQRLGELPLWERYGQNGATRDAKTVGSGEQFGAMYAWLVERLRPETVVEFGTAFGYSGMYFLAGIERAGTGRLYTFEPNREWREIAQRNLALVSGRYLSVEGTFEDNLSVINGHGIDPAFIDAIHTSEFVHPQFELVASRLRPGGVILLDDIDFSDDMAACWQELARDERVTASAALDGHVGLLTLGG